MHFLARGISHQESWSERSLWIVHVLTCASLAPDTFAELDLAAPPTVSLSPPSNSSVVTGFASVRAMSRQSTDTRHQRGNGRTHRPRRNYVCGQHSHAVGRGSRVQGLPARQAEYMEVCGMRQISPLPLDTLDRRGSIRHGSDIRCR